MVFTGAPVMPLDGSTITRAVLPDPLGSGRILVAASRFSGVFRAENDGSTAWELKINGMFSASFTAVDDNNEGSIFVRDPQMTPMRFNFPSGLFELFPDQAIVPGIQCTDLEYVDGPTRVVFETGFVHEPGIGPLSYLKRLGVATSTLWQPEEYVPEGLEVDFLIHLVASAAWGPFSGGPSRVYAWVSTGSGNLVYRSDDGGDSYAPVASYSGTIRNACVDPRDRLRVFAMTSSGEPVQLSTNGGVTWQPRTNGLPLGTPISLRMDEVNPDHLFACFSDVGAFTTMDGGNSWSPIPLDLQGAIPTQADWDPRFDRALIATQDHGIYASGIGFLNEGLESRDFVKILYDDSQERLVVSTTRMGLWTTSLPSAAVDVSGWHPFGTNPASLSLVATPNPFPTSTQVTFVPQPGEEVRSIDLFDVSGRRVRSLTASTRDGRATTLWDGRTNDGRAVAAGVYTVRVTTSRRVATTTVTRMR